MKLLRSMKMKMRKRGRSLPGGRIALLYSGDSSQLTKKAPAKKRGAAAAAPKQSQLSFMPCNRPFFKSSSDEDEGEDGGK